MFDLLPKTWDEFAKWDWSQIEPYFDNLSCRPVHAGNIGDWLSDWTRLARLILETKERLYVETTLHTDDPKTEQRYTAFQENIMQNFNAAEQKLREYLMQTEIKPPNFEVPLRQMQAKAEIFCEENLPLLTEEKKLGLEYDRIMGAQTVIWSGKDVTLEYLRRVQQVTEEKARRAAWLKTKDRQLADREAINNLWRRFMDVRGRIAANAGQPSFLDYRWKDLGRFAYTPDDCKRFHDAIEEVVVPVATRLYEKRRKRLGFETLRPWNLLVDADNRPPLRPYKTVDIFLDKTSALFHAMDAELGGYFDTMRQENLLDLENRKGKAPGGYCTEFHVVQRPFIFMNSVGIHDDLQTMVHEAGHAFHVFKAAAQPYVQLGVENIPTEFAEVASMSMELLTAKYFGVEGGFYDPEKAPRGLVEHLEGIIQFWPYMAVVDAFQHWVYENHADASDPANCDAKWDELWNRFMIGQDWTEYEDYRMTGWQRKLHIHTDPLYYIEYGLAELGAVQVWYNSLEDERGAIEAYKSALALGNSRPLPELFAAAGAKFQPDADTLRACVELAEETIERLDPAPV